MTTCKLFLPIDDLIIDVENVSIVTLFTETKQFIHTLKLCESKEFFYNVKSFDYTNGHLIIYV